MNPNFQDDTEQAKISSDNVPKERFSGGRGSMRLDSSSIQESLQALEKGNISNSDSDTIIAMSRQISSMAKEVESLKIQLFQMSDELKVLIFTILTK